MFFELLCFEWRCYSRRFLWLAAAFTFAGLGFAMTGRVGSGAPTLLNSAYALIPLYQLLTLAAVVKIAAFSAIAVLRDTNHDTEALVYSTGVTRARFLAARFSGLLTVSFSVVAAAALGIVLRAHWPHGLDGTFAGINPLLHLRILIVYVLPNLLFIASLLFAVALRTRHAAATFVAGLILYAFYLASASLIGSPFMTGEPATIGPKLQCLAALLDPLAVTPFFQQTESWTRPMRDTLFPPFSRLWLANRTLWLAVTALVWRNTLRGFHLQLPTARAKPWRFSLPTRTGPSAMCADAVYRAVQPSHGPTQNPRVWLACLRLELGLLVRSVPFWIILGLWCALLLGEIAPLTQPDLFGARRLPLTALLLKRFQFDLLPGFVLLVLLFYSGEIRWRERDQDIDALVATTAAGDGVVLAAKLTTLGLLPLLFFAVAVLLCVGFQCSHGWFHFEAKQYLGLVLFGGLPLVLWSAPFWLLQNLAPNKMIGSLAGAILCVLSYGGLCGALGLTHPLWRFGVIPGYRYSDMNGYHHLIQVFAWYSAFWVALALAMVLLRLGRQRGDAAQPLPVRLHGLMKRPRWTALTLSLLCVIGLGVGIGVQTHRAGGNRTTAASQQQRAEYEHRFAAFRHRAQPKIQAIETEMQLFPEQQRYMVEGRYQIHNHHNQPLSDMLVTLNPKLTLQTLQVAGATRSERDSGGVVFRFDPPLAPGAVTTLSFTIDHRNHGFGAPMPRHRVFANGTVLHSSGWFPTIGYVPAKELQSAAQRTKQGLSPIRTAAAPADAKPVHDDFIQFETRISTSADQTALAPGRLIAQGGNQNRRWFHYRADRPIRNAIVYLSARYSHEKQEVAGVQVSVYADAARPNNSKRLLQAAAATLAFGQRRFGASPPSELRIAAVPTLSGISGYAAPGLVLVGEHSGFEAMHRSGGAMSHGIRRTIHEVAHQWWGLQVAPANDDSGGMLFVESLAKTTELMLMEDMAGSEVMGRYLDREVARYFRERRRVTEPEVALSHMAPSQRYLTYAKGGAAFVALRNRLGAATLDRALQRLLQDHAYPGRPPTATDLVDLLIAEAPRHAAFIREWLTTVTFYRSNLERCELVALADGRQRLDIDLTLGKWRQDEAGEAQREAFTDQLSWTVTLGDGTILHQTTRVCDGPNRLSTILPSRPTAITIDAERALLDENRTSTQQALRAALAR